ncbi:MAG: glycosyltransferase family 4 protein [Opitutales bacterium]
MPDRPTLTFLFRSWPLSGVTTHTTDLCRGLQARGWRCRIAFLRYEPRYDLPFPHDLEKVHWQVNGTLRDQLVRLAKRINQEPPGILLPECAFEHAYACPLVDPAWRIVQRLHSDDPRYYQTTRFLGPHMDGLIAVSSFIGRRIQKKFPDLTDRLATIPYAPTIKPNQPMAIPHQSESPIRVLYLGRLNESQKKVRDIAAIIHETERRGIPCFWTFAGEGEERSWLEQSLSTQIQEGRVRFLGSVNPAQVPEILARHQVLILTSAFEGLPLALLEGQTAGLVPVVSNIRSGIGDQIENETDGFICPVGNAAAFAEVIGRLQQDPARWERMSQAGRQRQQGHTFEDMINAYDRVFSEVAVQTRRSVVSTGVKGIPMPRELKDNLDGDRPAMTD